MKMFRILACLSLISAIGLARGPYRVAVCGNSRYVEELELVLELDSRVLVGSCGDKKLDVRLKVMADRVFFESVSWKRREFSVGKMLGALATTTKARVRPSLRGGVADEAIQDTSKRESITESDTPPRNENLSIGSAGLVDLYDPVEHEKREVHWSLDTAISLDQWNAGLSTKVYPGFQLQTKIEFLPMWWVAERFAFGTSAFRLDDHIIWNEQINNHLWVSRQFELTKGLMLGPSIGYFVWGSLAGNEQITQFQKHDVSIGGRLSWISKKRRFELECASSLLPVHLGVEGQLITRFYFAPNWYGALQGYGLGAWGMGYTGSFLSASLGLGYAQ